MQAVKVSDPHLLRSDVFDFWDASNVWKINLRPRKPTLGNMCLRGMETGTINFHTW